MSWHIGTEPTVPWLTLGLIAVIAWLAHSRGYWKARCTTVEKHRED